jgi:hypothetical protein
MSTNRLPKILLNYKPRGPQVLDNPQLYLRTYSLEAGNKPVVYTSLWKEEEKE